MLGCRNIGCSEKGEPHLSSALFQKPREISITEPPLVALVGGFLGAGKTTAIIVLAERLKARGLISAVITNDQAPNLVDSTVLRSAGHVVEEVAGGCFCCKFTDFLEAMENGARCEPDVLLC